MFIYPDDYNLSLEAIGVLSTMLNVPENDYCTEKELYSLFPTDSPKAVHNTLQELKEKGFLLVTDSKKYAVNKFRIVEMRIV